MKDQPSIINLKDGINAEYWFEFLGGVNINSKNSIKWLKFKCKKIIIKSDYVR